MNPNLPQPSFVQRVCWLFAGAEMHLLRNCPADFNRQASIGFTIFMTCLFGALAGGYAAWRFTGNETGNGSWPAAIIFGLVWGLLIFSIDRSMVVTLKKNPVEKQSLWVALFAFLLRAVLAALLALLISIPLEVLIFKTKIDKELNDEILADETATKSRLEKRYGLPALIKQLADLKQDSVNIAAGALLPDPPTGEYITAKRELTELQREQISLENQLKNAQALASQWYQRVPLIQRFRYDKEGNIVKRYWVKNRKSPAYGQYARHNSESSRLSRLLEQKRQSVNKARETESRVRNDYYKRNQNLSKQIGKQLAAKIKGLEKAKLDVEERIKRELPVLQSRGFVREFTAMEAAADKDGGMLFLLTLIRLIFFTIEILPTLIKLITPVGEYDHLLYTHEQEFATRLRTNLSILQTQERLRQEAETGIATNYEALRQEVAKETNETVLRETADRQNKLALQKLDEWFQQQAAPSPGSASSNGKHSAAHGPNPAFTV